MAGNNMQMQQETADHVAKIDSRVTGLEVQFRALDANLTALGADTKANFQNLSAAINQLGAKLEGSQRTNWPVLISGALLIVSILSALGVAFWSPVKSELERLTAETRVLAKEKLDREESAMWTRLRDEQFARRDERDRDLQARVDRLEHKAYGF